MEPEDTQNIGSNIRRIAPIRIRPSQSFESPSVALELARLMEVVDIVNNVFLRRQTNSIRQRYALSSPSTSGSGPGQANARLRHVRGSRRLRSMNFNHNHRRMMARRLRNNTRPQSFRRQPKERFKRYRAKSSAKGQRQ